MLSVSSPSAPSPFVRGAFGRLVSLIVMRKLDAVFDVSLNKLLNKPSYDVTVMDDLALGGASLLSASVCETTSAHKLLSMLLLNGNCWGKILCINMYWTCTSQNTVALTTFQCIWNNHADTNSSTPRRTDRIKEVTCQIYVRVYNNCWYNVLFSERYRLEIGGVDPLKHVSIRTGVLGFLPYMVELNTPVRLDENFFYR